MEETQANTTWKEHGNQKLWWFYSLLLFLSYNYARLNFLNEYNDIMKYFLWNSSSTKIKIEGGIRLLDI